jgi:hypothetical protein
MEREDKGLRREDKRLERVGKGRNGGWKWKGEEREETAFIRPRYKQKNMERVD